MLVRVARNVLPDEGGADVATDLLGRLGRACPFRDPCAGKFVEQILGSDDFVQLGFVETQHQVEQ